MAEDAHGRAEPLRLGYVEGVTPGKWVRIWSERRPDRKLELVATSDADDDQLRVLRDDRLTLAFVRLPIDPAGLNVIPLYEETPVVVVATDQVVTSAAGVSLADLTGETVHPPHPAKDAIALVAAGVGVVVLPQSVARLFARRDVTAHPLSDAPTTAIALAWLTDDPARTTADAADIDEFIGVVRGRTARSSRGATRASRADERATDLDPAEQKTNKGAQRSKESTNTQARRTSRPAPRRSQQRPTKRPKRR